MYELGTIVGFRHNLTGKGNELSKGTIIKSYYYPFERYDLLVEDGTIVMNVKEENIIMILSFHYFYHAFLDLHIYSCSLLRFHIGLPALDNG